MTEFPLPPADLDDPEERDESDFLAPPTGGTYVGTTAIAGKAPGELAKEGAAIAYLTEEGLLFQCAGEPVWIPTEALLDAEPAVNAQVGVPFVVRWRWAGERYETGFLPEEDEASVAFVHAIKELAAPEGTNTGEGSAR
ncbi:hypothetical protein [Labedaea rhizosphaerae]|uniref:PH domain-containing protein n=1 Tax=Labedaea rhizosphaerae TaxID=598644 RepID=A0A4R6SJR6_LABRH|nr:hypothetical protein [Labedaea rhizosphaerae]TDQ01189.1 hypothetical protein EV186_1021056 [Labedaea rhizosphaerae]